MAKDKTIHLEEPVPLLQFMRQHPGNKFKFSEGGVPSNIKVVAYKQVRRTIHLTLEVGGNES